MRLLWISKPIYERSFHMLKYFKFKKTFLLPFSFLLIICLIPAGCSRYNKLQKPETEETETLSEQEAECMIIPKPVEYIAGKGNFTLSEGASICVNGNNDTQTEEIRKIGKYLADKLKPSTGYNLNVVKSKTPAKGSIYLTTVDGDSRLGEEGYHLEVTKNKVTLSAFTPEGLFRGIQTIRQLLPAEIEKSSVVTGTDWSMPCSSITDYPAYSWRGMMLDVARHFISAEDVKRTIDLIAQYKMNRFHMHLSDDQGWRIEIKSWPNLAKSAEVQRSVQGKEVIIPRKNILIS
jgi:hexosaminidase